MSSSPNERLSALLLHFGPKVTMTPEKTLNRLSIKPTHTRMATPLGGYLTTRTKETSVNSAIQQNPIQIPCCPICLETYDSKDKARRPRCLPYCGHVICEECLTKMIARCASENLTCHICKKLNSLQTHQTADSFPLSWPIIDSIEIMLTSSPPHPPEKAYSPTDSNVKQILCSHCGVREISHWCVHHVIKLCAYCAFRHAKECKKDKCIETNSVKQYFNNVLKMKSNLVAQVKEYIENSVKIKEDLLINIMPKLDDLIKQIEFIKSNVSNRIAFYELQLTEFLTEINSVKMSDEDFAKLTKEHLLKPYMRKISSLEDTLKKRADILKNQYKIQSDFNSEIHETVQKLISKILSVDTISPYFPNNKTDVHDALFRAVENGDESSMEFLIEQFKLDINKKDKNGMTPFCIAISKSDHKLYEKLFEQYKSDPNIPDNCNKSPLLYATMNSDEKAVEFLLLKCSANANTVCKWQDTPLHCAVETGNLKIIQMLVNEGHADISKPNGRGKKSFELTNSLEIKNFLLSKMS